MARAAVNVVTRPKKIHHLVCSRYDASASATSPELIRLTAKTIGAWRYKARICAVKICWRMPIRGSIFRDISSVRYRKLDLDPSDASCPGAFALF